MHYVLVYLHNNTILWLPPPSSVHWFFGPVPVKMRFDLEKGWLGFAHSTNKLLNSAWWLWQHRFTAGLFSLPFRSILFLFFTPLEVCLPLWGIPLLPCGVYSLPLWRGSCLDFICAYFMVSARCLCIILYYHIFD